MTSSFPVDPGWHLYIDPAVLADATPAEVGFWHLHHGAHLLRRHDRRCPLPSGAQPELARRSADEQRWNEACDAEIDDDLVPELARQQLAAPDRAVLPEHFQQPAGQLAEGYFLHRGQGPAPLPAPAADCGSGVDGRTRPWDTTAGGLSKLERSLLSRDAARRIREASRSRGDVPAGWTRWAEQVLEPVVDWRRQLAVAVRRGVSAAAGRVDYSYARPSRRAAAVPDVVLATMRRPQPKVALVVDTSGSVSDRLLGQALAEVGSMLRGLGVGGGRDALRLISCDAQAYGAQRVLRLRDVQLLGGGGTDMGAGLQAAGDLRPAADVVVVLTDGFTPWPDIPQGRCPVIVGLLDPSGSCPPWATRVLVTPDPVELTR